MSVADGIVLTATAVAALAYACQLLGLMIEPQGRKGPLSIEVVRFLKWPPLVLIVSYAVAVAASFWASKYSWEIFTFVALMICIASVAERQLGKRNEEGYKWAAVMLFSQVALVLSYVFFHVPPFGPETNASSASVRSTAAPFSAFR